MSPLATPIFCDHCARFALALLDGEILCAQCLLERIESGPPTAVILPLQLSAPDSSVGFADQARIRSAHVA